jgi:hypothetical protein
MVGALALASPAVHAQRGGGHGGGMGGGMGGGYGGGMSSGMQRGGSMGTMPGERPSERMGSPSQQGMAGDRQSQPGGPKTAGDLLQQNGKLSQGLAKLLPAGTDLQAAASGFRNLGEFVAAVHVSNNLGIPFDQLKDRMISGDSLGAAIHALRPGADAQVEARKAHAKAEEAVGSS